MEILLVLDCTMTKSQNFVVNNKFIWINMKMINCLGSMPSSDMEIGSNSKLVDKCNSNSGLWPNTNQHRAYIFKTKYQVTVLRTRETEI